MVKSATLLLMGSFPSTAGGNAPVTAASVAQGGQRATEDKATASPQQSVSYDPRVHNSAAEPGHKKSSSSSNRAEGAPPAESFRVTARGSHEIEHLERGLDEVEEEALQQAIAASLADSEMDGGARQISDHHKRFQNAADSVTSGAGAGRSPPAIGLNCFAWVDNSDFEVPRHNPASKDQESCGGGSSSRTRSEPPRPAVVAHRSGIVNLPRIEPILPREKKQIVEDLHEIIEHTTHDPSMQGPRAIDVSALVDSADLPGRPGKSSRGYNKAFHSCRGGRIDEAGVEQPEPLTSLRNSYLSPR